MYTKFLAIGLFRLLELGGAKDPKALEGLVTALNVRTSAVNRDLLTYKARPAPCPGPRPQSPLPPGSPEPSPTSRTSRLAMSSSPVDMSSQVILVHRLLSEGPHSTHESVHVKVASTAGLPPAPSPWHPM